MAELITRADLAEMVQDFNDWHKEHGLIGEARIHDYMEAGIWVRVVTRDLPEDKDEVRWRTPAEFERELGSL